MNTYLIQVNHDVSFQSLAGFDTFQGQGEVDPPRVWYVEVIRVVLIPLLDGGEHLVLIRADDMHVLPGGHSLSRAAGEHRLHPRTSHEWTLKTQMTLHKP